MSSLTQAPRVRAAVPDDAAAVARIYNHYVLNTVVTFEEQAVPVADMAGRIGDVQNDAYPWLVAEQDGVVIGYAYATCWKVRSAYRHSVEATIYLDPGRERRGTGTLLYAALIKLLRERGIHVVIGGAAQPNDASAALHEKLGFVRVGTFRQVGFKHGRWVDVAYWELVL